MPGTRKLGRPTDHRKAMLRAMVTYLLENGQIETTVTRAKEVRSMAEKMITIAKTNDLQAKRQVMSYVTKEDVAKKIGIGAILYTFLKNSREKDIVFSWDSMLDFEGESAPYVQYSYARGRSILRRCDMDYKDANLKLLVSDEEYELVKQINAYATAVLDAASKNEPFYINRYVTTLAKCFNKFYNSHPILKGDVDDETKKARLCLVDATTVVIKSALSLLGIETVETM